MLSTDTQVFKMFEEGEVKRVAGGDFAAVMEGEIGEKDRKSDLEEELFETGQALAAPPPPASCGSTSP